MCELMGSNLTDFALMLSGLVVPDMDDFKIWSQLYIYFSASVYLTRHYILDLNITLKT